LTYNRLGADPGERTESLKIITSFTEPNPCSEASSTSTSQEIPRILRTMKVYYRFYKKNLFLYWTSPLHPIL